MQALVTVNSAGIKINTCVNAKIWLINIYAIKYLSGILVIASVNVINLVIFESIQTMKIVNVEKKLVDKLI